MAPGATIHLLAADDVALHMAAMRAHPRWRDEAWVQRFGVDRAQGRALLAAVADALDGRRLTREELAAAVEERVGAWVAEPLRSTWGVLLPPAAFAGALCFGPSQGSRVTFVRVDQWTGKWADADPDTARAEVVRRFLSAYGPATEAEVAAWLSAGPADARRVLDGMREELAQVDLDGRRRLMLAVDEAGDWPSPAPGPTLRLLPQYDSYVLGHRQRDRLVPPAAGAAIAADPKGRLEHVVGVSVVLVDGVVGGIWRRAARRERLDVTVEPSMPLGPAHRRLLEAEVARVAAYLGKEATISYAA